MALDLHVGINIPIIIGNANHNKVGSSNSVGMWITQKRETGGVNFWAAAVLRQIEHAVHVGEFNAIIIEEDELNST